MPSAPVEPPIPNRWGQRHTVYYCTRGKLCRTAAEDPQQRGQTV
ncbi:hypothetical protein THTE_1737 [Thermogutta terrifontis]|uniref:Uncharacterized protein n=1 Tax=Thermogutta terrifontis TaxID=1331910 RepID=A0A286REE2_9BACT|nr:hypothetical protein THTE_1737 [Thermogutta terrifontis]